MTNKPPCIVTRIDGLPLDALPEAPDAPPQWEAGLHIPSYRKGWRWGLVDGIFIGALLVGVAVYLSQLWGAP